MRQPKILVEIYNGNELQFKKKYPFDGNRVIIVASKAAPGGAEYAPKFDKDSKIYYYEGRWIFKRLKQKLMLQNGAKECMKMTPKMLKINEPTRITIKEFAKAEVVKAAGATVQRMTAPTLLYVLVFANIVISTLALLLGSGTVQFV